MRQYRVMTKTPDTDYTILEPGVHTALFNLKDVQDAIEFINSRKHVEMVGIRIGGRVYTIVVVTSSDTLLDNHIELDA